MSCAESPIKPGLTRRGLLRVVPSLAIGTGLTFMGTNASAAFPDVDLDWLATAGNLRGDLGKLIMLTENPYTRAGRTVRGYTQWRQIATSDMRPSLVTWRSGSYRILRSIRIPYAAPDNIETGTPTPVAEALIVGLSFDQTIPPRAPVTPSPATWGGLPASPQSLDRLGNFIINSMKPIDEALISTWSSRTQAGSVAALALAGEDQSDRPRWRFRGTEVSLERLIEIPVVITNTFPNPNQHFMAKLVVGYEGGAAY